VSIDNADRSVRFYMKFPLLLIPFIRDALFLQAVKNCLNFLQLVENNCFNVLEQLEIFIDVELILILVIVCFFSELESN